MATSKNIADFRPEIDLYVKKASDDTTFVDAQILRTIRDFCKETWCWRQTLVAIDVVEDDFDYTLTMLTTDGTSELHMIDWVKYKEDGADDNQYAYVRPINIETEEVLSSTGISAGYVYGEGTALDVFWVDPDNTLQVRPIPNAAAAGTANMLVKVIAVPALTAVKVPIFIYNDWLEIISWGTAARIMRMAAKKWYNPQLAEYYAAEYKKGRDNEAKMERWYGKNRTQGHVRIHKGFSGGSRGRSSIF
jgi:hypothetical protein